jgi:predicted molibdopterin-dependent oxidoreductase YjgC
VFGAGGGTSSYQEIEETDLIVMWGSNAREAHPIFFHHVLRGVHNGARMFAVDPRRTSTAAWADVWLGIDVGSDIALANAVGREIIEQGLHNTEFIANATEGFDAYAECVDRYTLERGEEITGVPAFAIQQLAHEYGSAETAQICWTLGITEHHNATDNVLALINLALLTGHVGRYGSGLVPVRGQNNVQGGGDMGALPNKLPGFQDVENADMRGKFEAVWGTEIPAKAGLHISLMHEAMDEGILRCLYVLGENPLQSEADAKQMRRRLENLEFMVAQDIFLTATAELADVVLPAAGWGEAEGTFTSSERRVQRVRKAIDPPGESRDDIEILSDLARAMGHDWETPTAEQAWDEMRSLSPLHGGMSYQRLEAMGGIQWPCPDESSNGELFLHGRLWDRPMTTRKAPFHAVEYAAPVDELSEEFPTRLTTGRRLDSYNTGVQSGRYSPPRRISGVLDLSPEDGADLGVSEGDLVKVTSRRGSLEAPVRFDRSLRPGLAFMSVHFPDETDVNQLTIDAWDPKSGTAEFKATAIRVEPIGAGTTG